MFAVIQIGSSQHLVTPKDSITVDRIEGETGKKLSFDKVLLISDQDKTIIGTPIVAKASVTANITAQIQGKKIHVRRFKSKVRYRKHIGFRPQQTKIEIISIKIQ